MFVWIEQYAIIMILHFTQRNMNERKGGIQIDWENQNSNRPCDGRGKCCWRMDEDNYDDEIITDREWNELSLSIFGSILDSFEFLKTPSHPDWDNNKMCSKWVRRKVDDLVISRYSFGLIIWHLVDSCVSTAHKHTKS